jgi:hypothetical protein
MVQTRSNNDRCSNGVSEHALTTLPSQALRRSELLRLARLLEKCCYDLGCSFVWSLVVCWCSFVWSFGGARLFGLSCLSVLVCLVLVVCRCSFVWPLGCLFVCRCSFVWSLGCLFVCRCSFVWSFLFDIFGDHSGFEHGPDVDPTMIVAATVCRNML